MMVLGFSVGDASYGVSIEYVSEVVPLLSAKPSQCGVVGVLGVFDFRGERIPLFDVRLAREGVGADQALSTRIIILDWEGARVGLLAEQVIELFDVGEDGELQERTLVTPGVIIPEEVYTYFSK